MSVTKELHFIKFIDGLKIRYSNENCYCYKSHFNSIVSLMSIIKEFDKEYQVLAPINSTALKFVSSLFGKTIF